MFPFHILEICFICISICVLYTIFMRIKLLRDDIAYPASVGTQHRIEALIVGQRRVGETIRKGQFIRHVCYSNYKCGQLCL